MALYHPPDDDKVLAYNGIQYSLAQLVKEKVPVLSTGFKPVWWLPEYVTPFHLHNLLPWM